MGDKAVYHRGEMEIADQAATFHGFVGLTKWGSLTVSVAVLFLTLIFCAHVGFFQAVAAAVVVAAAGILLLREKKSAAH
jgi:hypothetical protein